MICVIGQTPNRSRGIDDKFTKLEEMINQFKEHLIQSSIEILEYFGIISYPTLNKTSINLN